MYCSKLQKYIIFSEYFYPPLFNISLILYGRKSVATVGADEEDAAGALLKYEIQEGAGSVELGFFI